MIQFDVKKITLERANKLMGISELADKAGITRKTVSAIEKGKENPRADTIGKIAKALGKTIEDFIIE